MKNTLLILLIIGLFACRTSKETAETATKTVAKTPLVDNAELIEIYKNDQADRQAMNINWKVVSRNDSLREVRIYELLDSNKVQTSRDYRNAAMIFQHGGDSTAYGMAVKLMQKSVDLDTTASKWLLAAATDRYLMSKNEPQIYGTQYQKFGADEPWKLAKIDTTKITDAERIEYGVETLAQQREKVIRMNKKKLSTLLNEGKTVDEIITFINSKNKEKSEFDVSESGINSFGYQLMGTGSDAEALKIFKLNTELYPEGFNTFDSYGECLVKIGRTAEGIVAYKKSLELNPKNDGAKKVLAELEK